MGQGQTGFQPLLLLHKLCPIHPSKQMAATLSPSNRELPSLAQTCFISLLQNPTETPRVHCQNEPLVITAAKYSALSKQGENTNHSNQTTTQLIRSGLLPFSGPLQPHAGAGRAA